MLTRSKRRSLNIHPEEVSAPSLYSFSVSSNDLPSDEGVLVSVPPKKRNNNNRSPKKPHIDHNDLICSSPIRASSGYNGSAPASAKRPRGKSSSENLFSPMFRIVTEENSPHSFVRTLSFDGDEQDSSSASESPTPENATAHLEYLHSVNTADPVFLEMAEFLSVLPPPPTHIPALPQKTGNKPMTLVLDLDETLVHCSITEMPDCTMTFPVDLNDVHYTVYVRERPHLRDFLRSVSQVFEVVLFTASQRLYADKLTSFLDPDGTMVSHRLFREHCVNVDGNYIKDLGILGRPLSSTLIVDNSPHAFVYHTSNAIPIVSWYDDFDDTELVKLHRFLQYIAACDFEDVRPLLRSFFRLPERFRCD